MADEPRIDEVVARWVAEIEQEDARAKANGEAHGNYGEEFGTAVFWLRDCRAQLEVELRDARAEIDKLQAAVRELRNALTWTLDHHKSALGSRPHAAEESISNSESVLARTDKLVPETNA